MRLQLQIGDKIAVPIYVATVLTACGMRLTVEYNGTTEDIEGCNSTYRLRY